MDSYLTRKGWWLSTASVATDAITRTCLGAYRPRRSRITDTVWMMFDEAMIKPSTKEFVVVVTQANFGDRET